MSIFALLKGGSGTRSQTKDASAPPAASAPRASHYAVKNLTALSSSDEDEREVSDPLQPNPPHHASSSVARQSRSRRNSRDAAISALSHSLRSSTLVGSSAQAVPHYHLASKLHATPKLVANSSSASFGAIEDSSPSTSTISPPSSRSDSHHSLHSHSSGSVGSPTGAHLHTPNQEQASALLASLHFDMPHTENATTKTPRVTTLHHQPRALRVHSLAPAPKVPQLELPEGIFELDSDCFTSRGDDVERDDSLSFSGRLTSISCGPSLEDGDDYDALDDHDESLSPRHYSRTLSARASPVGVTPRSLSMSITSPPMLNRPPSLAHHHSPRTIVSLASSKDNLHSTAPIVKSSSPLHAHRSPIHALTSLIPMQSPNPPSSTHLNHPLRALSPAIPSSRQPHRLSSSSQAQQTVQLNTLSSSLNSIAHMPIPTTWSSHSSNTASLLLTRRASLDLRNQQSELNQTMTPASSSHGAPSLSFSQTQPIARRESLLVRPNLGLFEMEIDVD